MTFTSHVRSTGILLTTLFLSHSLAAEQPNVLIIMADDYTFNDLPLYGGQNARMPNIDRLARQGLTFNRAYLSSAMCQPCRSELFSSQYPMRTVVPGIIPPAVRRRSVCHNDWESLAIASGSQAKYM